MNPTNSGQMFDICNFIGLRMPCKQIPCQSESLTHSYNAAQLPNGRTHKAYAQLSCNYTYIRYIVHDCQCMYK